MKPPEKLTLLYCPVCGRDDRYQPFTGKRHFAAGIRCNGVLRKLTYTLNTRSAA